MMQYLHVALASILVAAALLYGGSWLTQYEAYEALTIRAPRDMPERAEPIFAQFTVTQTLTIDEPTSMTGLVVPLHMSASGHPFTVALRRNGNEVQSWELVTEAHDTLYDTRLLLDYPRLLDGKLEVELTAPQISHDNAGSAPRVPIELADENYPDGNFRIAENEKSGDIALTLEAQQKRWQRLWREWKFSPLDGAVSLGASALVLMLIAALPGLVQRQLLHRSRKAE